MIKKMRDANKRYYSGLSKPRVLMTLYLLFVAGCIIGWIYEELYYMLDDHVLVNRGFMYGPWLPVYGVGTILMLAVLNKLRPYPVFIFLGGTVLCGALEYLAGMMVWNGLHKHLWDYTGLFLNIQGYVCLRSAITFGFLALFLFYVLEPATNHFLRKLDDRAFFKFGFIVMAVFVFDLVMSLIFRR